MNASTPIPPTTGTCRRASPVTVFDAGSSGQDFCGAIAHTRPWISHSFKDNGLFVSIRFTDNKEFSLQFSSTILTDSIDLSDMSTGNFEMIREYYRRKV